MFLTFFAELKGAGVPVSLKEYLTLIAAMDQNVASYSTEDFYYLSRAALVKDVRTHPCRRLGRALERGAGPDMA